MRGVMYAASSPEANADHKFTIQKVSSAMLFLTELEPAIKLFHERCGEDATFVIGGEFLTSIEPVEWGNGLGNLKVTLFHEKDHKRVSFRIGFKGVDSEETVPVAEDFTTSIPVDLDFEDAVVALSAIHEAAKASLNSGSFSQSMQVMASMDGAAIAKLRA